MKSFDEVESPNTKPVKAKPVNLDDLVYKYEEEKVWEELVISRIVPFLVAKYPEMLDASPVLRRPEDLAQVYKNIPLQTQTPRGVKSAPMG